MAVEEPITASIVPTPAEEGAAVSDTSADDTAEVLDDLKTVVSHMAPGRRKKFLAGQRLQTRYLEWELTFNPRLLRKYSPGEVLLVDFGWNVGAEFGGRHWAVVVEQNDRAAATVMVVPLSSLKPGQTAADVHRRDAYVGVIEGLNPNKAVAKVPQMRAVSKIRIVKPRTVEDGPANKITPDQLAIITSKIKELFI